MKWINCSRPCFINSVSTGTCNEMINIPSVHIQETLFLPSNTKSFGLRAILRPEKKSGQCMMDITLTFTDLGELVVDSYSGRCSVVISFILCAKHRNFSVAIWLRTVGNATEKIWKTFSLVRYSTTNHILGQTQDV